MYTTNTLVESDRRKPMILLFVEVVNVEVNSNLMSMYRWQNDGAEDQTRLLGDNVTDDILSKAWMLCIEKVAVQARK